ncbi:MAG TPA: hypothetical protein VLX12_05355 [Syntrophorhabdales bacterium]|nr:hypothetical protein [Syntrophorhabdales bacterium]
MKKNLVVFSFGVLSLFVALAGGAAIAQPQGIGRGQIQSGTQNFGPGASLDTATQIRGLTDQIKAVQQQICDSKRETKRLLDDLKKLRASRPTPPKGESSEEKATYKKNMSEWQYKVTAKEHEVYVAHAQLNQLEQRLKNVQQQLATLQAKTAEGSGK